MSPLAFELDKDGVGEGPDPVPDDEAFDDVELGDRPVLVVDTTSTDGLETGAAVRVSATVREFDVDDAERLFGLDLDDRIYDPFDEALVLVATEVVKLTGDAEASTSTTGP